jgi:hypothetical protein
MEERESIDAVLNDLERRNELSTYINSGLSVDSIVRLLKYQGEITLLLFSALSLKESKSVEEDLIAPVVELYNRLQKIGIEEEKFGWVTEKSKAEKDLTPEMKIEIIIDKLKNSYVTNPYLVDKVNPISGTFAYVELLEKATNEAKSELPSLLIATQLTLVLERFI